MDILISSNLERLIYRVAGNDDKRNAELMEMLSDYLLLSEADKRMAENNDSENISHEEMMRRLGITPDELEDTDVEIEV